MAGSPDQSSLIPDGYAAKMRQAQASRAMQGERRVISILFCDVTGSTSMAERLDPEEWAEIMNEAFQYMIAPIYTYEGTVARLMGDAVVAFFGAPIAHEDDPQRAVLAGLDIVSGIKLFANEIRQTYGMDFNVRVGINTGPVVVGEIGSDLAMEYTAMGDAVNLAARMEQSAKPGTVQIAENTRRLVDPFFELTPLGALSVKGKELPVNAFRVERSAIEPGSLRGIKGIESPLVGRESELSRMKGLIDDIQTGDTGQIAFVIGEAGLGKSRLTDELHNYWLATREPTSDGWKHWDQMAAVSFGTGRPFGVFKHQIRLITGITESDSPQEARDKLSLSVKMHPPDLQRRLYDLFAILLDISEDHSGQQPEGEDFKRELFDAYLAANKLRGAGLPTVLVADDIHWGDPASLESLEYLTQLVSEHPLLLIAVMRPESETPAWTMKERVAARFTDRYTEITLNPLSGSESASLVDQLLPVHDMPPEVRALILERTDGNPFFIEEVIRALIDRGTLLLEAGVLHWNAQQSPAQLTIPGNVQALLAARIDRLEKETRHTLQLASVIGRNFYRRVLETISETATTLDEQLEELEMLSLIREAASRPELEYTFRHALTRDATYATILRRRRRQFHKRVAEAIETLFPDRLEEEAHRLADHFNEAFMLDKAQHYYTMAGDQAMRLYANMEAIDHFTKALDIARHAGAENQLVNICRRLGRTYELGGQYDEALAFYREMQETAVARDMPQLQLQAILSKATIRSTFTVKYNPKLGRKLANEALELAQELDDPRAMSKAYWNLLLLNTYTDEDAAQTIAYGEKAAAIAREHNLREELAYALHDLARPYVMVGRVADGQAALDEASHLWRDLGRSGMLADNRTTLAENLNLHGDLQKAIALTEESLQISRRSSNNWGKAYALGTMAPVLMETGRVDEALAAWEESLEAAERANFSAPQIYARTHMALSLAQLGEFDRAFAIIREVESVSGTLSLATFVALPNMCESHLHILAGNYEEARRMMPQTTDRLELSRSEPIMFSLIISTSMLLKLSDEEYDAVLLEAGEMVELAEQGGLLILVPELKLLMARPLYGLGRLDEAAAVLDQAAAQARSFGAIKTLLPILALQMEIETQRGSQAVAAAAREEGQEIAAFIAGHISDPDLRSKFLSTEAVHNLQDSEI